MANVNITENIRWKHVLTCPRVVWYDHRERMPPNRSYRLQPPRLRPNFLGWRFEQRSNFHPVLLKSFRERWPEDAN